MDDSEIYFGSYQRCHLQEDLETAPSPSDVLNLQSTALDTLGGWAAQKEAYNGILRGVLAQPEWRNVFDAQVANVELWRARKCTDFGGAIRQWDAMKNADDNQEARAVAFQKAFASTLSLARSSGSLKAVGPSLKALLENMGSVLQAAHVDFSTSIIQVFEALTIGKMGEPGISFMRQKSSHLAKVVACVETSVTEEEMTLLGSKISFDFKESVKSVVGLAKQLGVGFSIAECANQIAADFTAEDDKALERLLLGYQTLHEHLRLWKLGIAGEVAYQDFKRKHTAASTAKPLVGASTEKMKVRTVWCVIPNAAPQCPQHRRRY